MNFFKCWFLFHGTNKIFCIIILFYYQFVKHFTIFFQIHFVQFMSVFSRKFNYNNILIFNYFLILNIHCKYNLLKKVIKAFIVIRIFFCIIQITWRKRQGFNIILNGIFNFILILTYNYILLFNYENSVQIIFDTYIY